MRLFPGVPTAHAPHIKPSFAFSVDVLPPPVRVPRFFPSTLTIPPVNRPLPVVLWPDRPFALLRFAQHPFIVPRSVMAFRSPVSRVVCALLPSFVCRHQPRSIAASFPRSAAHIRLFPLSRGAVFPFGSCASPFAHCLRPMPCHLPHVSLLHHSAQFCR